MSTNKGWSKKPFEGEWAQTLKNYLTKRQEKVPKGFLKSDEALEKMGFKGNSAGQRNKLLNQMALQGFLEKKHFRIFDGSGRRISPIAHFKIKKSSNSID